MCWGKGGGGGGVWGIRWEVGWGLGRNKVDDEAEIVETWRKRMTEICTYIWESFGGAIWCACIGLIQYVCLAKSVSLRARASHWRFLGMASLRFSEWHCCLGRHGMAYQMELV